MTSLVLDSPYIDAAGGIIHTPVTAEPPTVFKEILQCGDTQNEDYGNHGDFFTEGIDSRNPIKQHDEYKVQIGHTMKLFQQITR